jgi:hypothetical protein
MSHERKHFAVDKLSVEGKTLVISLLENRNETFDSIVKALREKTGEQIALSSLHRYHHANKLLLHNPDQLFAAIKAAMQQFNPAELQVLERLLLSLADIARQAQKIGTA